MKSLAVLLLMVCLFAAIPAAQAQQQTNPFIIPINFTSADGTFQGTFEVLRFATSGQGITAVGQLTGTVTNAAGVVVGTVSQRLRLPLLTATGSCTVLHLELGPLDLNLLGLMVHLDRVVLDITAQSGPGNLLGNLLCAIANLLNNGGPLDQIVGLLNQLLNILG
jgi:hypothetical protein